LDLPGRLQPLGNEACKTLIRFLSNQEATTSNKFRARWPSESKKFPSIFLTGINSKGVETVFGYGSTQGLKIKP